MALTQQVTFLNGGSEYNGLLISIPSGPGKSVLIMVEEQTSRFGEDIKFIFDFSEKSRRSSVLTLLSNHALWPVLARNSKLCGTFLTWVSQMMVWITLGDDESLQASAAKRTTSPVFSSTSSSFSQWERSSPSSSVRALCTEVSPSTWKSEQPSLTVRGKGPLADFLPSCHHRQIQEADLPYDDSSVDVLVNPSLATLTKRMP